MKCRHRLYNMCVHVSVHVNLVTYMQSAVNMVANEGATVVRLPLDIKVGHCRF